MPGPPFRPLAALVLVQFSFASLAVVGKVAVEAWGPLPVAGLRMFFASLFLAALALAATREVPRRADLAKLFGLSLLGITLNQLLFLEGLSRTSAINATILIATIPVFTTLLAILLGKERARPLRLFGIAVAFAGALALIGLHRWDLRDENTVGNVLVVANALCYSFYLVLSRPMLNRYRSTTVVAWTFLFGALLILPLAVPELVAVLRGPLEPRIVWAMVWIILVPSVLAYSLNNYALKRVESSTVAVYVFLQPLIGVALALLVLPEEHLTLPAIVGGLGILLGVILVSATERFEPVAAIPESGEAMSRQPLAPSNGRLEPQPQEDDQRGGRKEAP